MGQESLNEICVAHHWQVRRGLDQGFKPELSLDGTGGTYFLRDAARQRVAVFKPKDEEPFAPNNPRCRCELLS